MDNIERSELLLKAADECVKHAEGSHARKQWNMSIRRSQEAVEIFLRGVLALIGMDCPKDHDQAPVLLRVLKSNGFDLGKDASEIERISVDLSRKRGPALHQEEGYTKETADKALKEMKFVFSTIEKIKKEIFQNIKGK